MRWLKSYLKDKKEASKLNAKLKLGKRYKFGPIHLYRRVLLGLASDLNSLMTSSEWKPKNTPFGKHRVTWSEWETRIKRVCPIQFYMREEFLPNIEGFFRCLRRRFYELKCKYWKKYNVIHVKTLPPTWCDEDTLLVHAMFAVLERFMSQKPNECADYELKYISKEEMGMSYEDWEEYAKPQRLFWKEISEVWDWWQKREERETRLQEAYTLAGLPERRNLSYHETYKEVNELEDQFDKELELALQTIIKHRKKLWV